MRNVNERNSSSSSPIDCDVGLGLKMQSTETYSSCKRATMASSPYYNYQQLLSSGSNVNPTSFSGEAGDGGGSLLNQLAGGGGGGDIYEAGVTSVLPMTFHNSGFRPTGGVYGKAPFTASQWQELERQKIIHKYMMANIPVPPELLLPISRTSLAPVSQSSTPGLELRFPSSGSALEPWRCKRTDGKKWRCSRDVAPDQKYCERHAHKSKARSRKPVEVSPHKFTNNTTNNKAIQTTQAPFQRPTSLFPTMASATPYNDQTRSIEWFMRCGANNQQQWQQLFQTSSSSSTTTLDFSRHNTDQRQPQYEDNKQPDFTSLNEPYIPDTNFSDSILELNANKTTRHFIDAWEKEGLDQIDGISPKGKKFSPSSSLTLSMSAGNGFDDEDFNFNGYLGIGMMNNNNNKNLDNVNPVSWMNNSAAPGGPLGEALCLGNASTTRGNSNLPSPRLGYSNNSNTNTNSSGCSKSSCEDGRSHALNFIG